MRNEFLANYLPQQLAYFEKVLKSNAGGDGYFAGDKVGDTEFKLHATGVSSSLTHRPNLNFALK